MLPVRAISSCSYFHWETAESQPSSELQAREAIPNLVESTIRFRDIHRHRDHAAAFGRGRFGG